ncbi:MAG TPA: FAD binding domain-containing protein [Anaerolineales bacterium]|nr:FAD binding domain-containing protein [Anaerolineales bacterium]
MIIAYHRPESLDEALRLLSRPSPRTVPLGGGTLLSHHGGDDIEVVDLQSLGMNTITERGHRLEVGATTSLQQLLEWKSCPPALATALRLEAPLNLRNASSLAGTLVAADGLSTATTALLALDAQLALRLATIESMGLGEFLPARGRMPAGYLITAVEWLHATTLEFEYVARTAMDRPIIAVAVARWTSGRTRVAVGGWGPLPLLAMDGPEAAGAEDAVRNACHAATDAWGSASYRMDVGAVLAGRCLARLGAIHS